MIPLRVARVTLALVICSVTCTADAGEPSPALARHDFEQGADGWSARLSAVHVAPVDGGATSVSRRSLRIHGTAPSGWNYARSRPIPLRPGVWVRLGAWVRIEKLSAAAPSPFLKCELVRVSAGGAIRANTAPYDLRRRGEWQRLEVDFRIPEGVNTGYLAFEKGTEAPTEIDATLDDVALEVVQPFGSVTAREAHATPTPPTHPQLLLGAHRLESLRAAIAGPRMGEWTKILSVIDGLIDAPPPAYRAAPRPNEVGQLWQRDVGNALPYLALGVRLRGAPSDRTALERWTRAALSYPTWGFGRDDGLGLEAGHLLFGLATVYDWCFHEIDPALRGEIRAALIDRAGRLFEAASAGHAGLTRALLKNTMWVPLAGLSAAAIALRGDHREADQWLDLILDRMGRVSDALGPDGACPEGVGYWGYGVEYLLKTLIPLRQVLGVDLLDRTFWRETAGYRLHHSLPRNAWTRTSSVVNIGDSPRSNWYGPDYLLSALATLFDDPIARGLADRISSAELGTREARWIGLVVGDAGPTLPASAAPTFHHFDDLGIVTARTNWSGDESLVVFKVGPPLGHAATRRFREDLGAAHAHPDAGHFVVFGLGQWLLRDDGYGPKWTSQHNTLLVNGQGQLGEGGKWLDGEPWMRSGASPSIVRATTSAGLDRISADVAAAYPVSARLRRAVRHLLFVKPDTLIVIDDLESPRGTALELRFHPEQPAKPLAAGSWLAKIGDARLRIDVLTPDGVDTASEEVAAAGIEQGDHGLLYPLRLRFAGERWKNAVALSWSMIEPNAIRLERSGEKWIFISPNWRLRYNWATDSAVLDSIPVAISPLKPHSPTLSGFRAQERRRRRRARPCNRPRSGPAPLPLGVVPRVIEGRNRE